MNEWSYHTTSHLAAFMPYLYASFSTLNILISLHVDSIYSRKTRLGLLEVSCGTTKSSGCVSLEFLETKIVRVKYRANRWRLPRWIRCVCGATVMQHLCKTARDYEGTHLHLIWSPKSVIPGPCEYCLSKAKYRHTSL